MIDLSGFIVVLDLDDTLYLERSFVCSGFEAVGCWMQAEHGVVHFSSTCTDLFEQGVRGKVFDRALEALGLAGRGIVVDELVNVYRAHRPEIVLAPDAERLLRRLQGTPCALVTDGPLVCQENKVAALELDRLFTKVIFTARLPPGCGKPHSMAFKLVEQWSGRAPRQHVYVADNPAKDFLAPRYRGWLTVQIERDGRIHQREAPTADHAAAHTISSLDELTLRKADNLQAPSFVSVSKHIASGPALATDHDPGGHHQDAQIKQR